MDLRKPKKAFEIITLITYKDLNRKFLQKYIVVSTSVPKAVSMIQLREGEEILTAKEMEHELVLK